MLPRGNNYEYMNYGAMIAYVLANGEDRESRIGPTKEILGFTTSFPMGQLFYRPKMFRKLGWLEGLQLLSGVFVEGDYVQMIPNLLWEYKVADSGYGPKILEQLYDIHDQLSANPETRRAVAFIGGKEYSGERTKPCISSYQFIRSGERLHLVMNARSWDLISGFIYDTQVAGMIGIAMALSLNLEPGVIYGSAGSGHVYLKDVREGRAPKEDSRTFRMMRPVNYYAGRPWSFYRSAASVDLETLRGLSDDGPVGYEFSPSFISIERGMLK